jgi:two-component system chemotaxis response regulator CheB
MTPPFVPIQVLVVEDSDLQRDQLNSVLQQDGDIAVTGRATTGAEAIGMVARAQPHVVILNLHLPDGSSQHAIEQIMARTPTPILALSTRIDDRHSPSAIEALVAGALDALPTPIRWTPELGAELRRTVRLLRKVKVIRHPRGGLPKMLGRNSAPSPGQSPVVAIAASTGGPSALATVLSGLGGLGAPVLVVQHLHSEFTGGLLDWMSRVSALPVEIARHGQTARAGHVYLAPGGAHLRLGSELRLELVATPTSMHRPSADQLFLSVAERAGWLGVGALLTGMGDDGAAGLLQIHRQGGRTFAQDEASCAVFGMPRAAQRLGAVADADMLPLDHIAAALRRAVLGVRV